MKLPKNFKMDSQGPRHIHECEDCKPKTHTPTPWHIKELTQDGYVVIGPLKREGAALVLKENVQDAAFIVRAVNAHEKLIESLRIALQIIENIGLPGNFSDSMKKDWQNLVNIAKQAIAQAEDPRHG